MNLTPAHVLTPARSERGLSRGDAVSLVVFMIAGLAIAVTTVVAAALRVGEVLRGGEVPVLAEFRGTPADAPIGPDGRLVSVDLDTAVIVAPELPAAAAGALVLQQVVIAVAVLVVVGALLWLTTRILRGTIFSRTNTRLVSVAGITGLVGFAAAPFFGNMGANGAFARISDRTFENVVMAVDLFPLILLSFVAALSVLVFTVGERLQRETEGLV